MFFITTTKHLRIIVDVIWYNLNIIRLFDFPSDNGQFTVKYERKN